MNELANWNSTNSVDAKMDTKKTVMIVMPDPGAYTVAPAELEALLLEHPDVKDCAVVGVADREAGEIPKAFVVLKSGAGVDGNALMDFLRNKVAGYKRVRQVELVDAIPRSPSGKILRRLLAEKSQ